MPRVSRRDELLEVALEHFLQHGFDGTSVGALAGEMDVSKAAVSYHFPAKEDLLVALAEPLVAELEALTPGSDAPPPWPDGVRALLTDYLDVLMRHNDVATWLDGDQSVTGSTAIGERLRRVNLRMRRALVGGPLTTRSRIAASVALGALWRPVRHVDAADVDAHRGLMVESALAALRDVR